MAGSLGLGCCGEGDGCACGLCFDSRAIRIRYGLDRRHVRERSPADPIPGREGGGASAEWGSLMRVRVAGRNSAFPHSVRSQTWVLLQWQQNAATREK